MRRNVAVIFINDPRLLVLLGSTLSFGIKLVHSWKKRVHVLSILGGGYKQSLSNIFPDSCIESEIKLLGTSDQVPFQLRNVGMSHGANWIKKMRNGW